MEQKCQGKGEGLGEGRAPDTADLPNENMEHIGQQPASSCLRSLEGRYVSVLQGSPRPGDPDGGCGHSSSCDGMHITLDQSGFPELDRTWKKGWSVWDWGGRHRVTDYREGSGISSGPTNRV